MKYITTIALLTFLFIGASAQVKPKELPKGMPKIGKNPICFVDSVKVSRADMVKTNADSVSMVTVITGETALKIDPTAVDGILYVETTRFAKRRFWRYLTSKSETYAQMFPTPSSDTSVQYILNGKIKKSFEGCLDAVDDTVFKEVKILPKETLIKEYQITDKTFGILIVMDTSKNKENN